MCIKSDAVYRRELLGSSYKVISNHEDGTRVISFSQGQFHVRFEMNGNTCNQTGAINIYTFTYPLDVWNFP